LKEALTPYIESGELGTNVDPAISLPSLKLEQTSAQHVGDHAEEEPS
jgi:RNA polymerase sigma-70 factor (ECF subfamily)